MGHEAEGEAGKGGQDERIPDAYFAHACSLFEYRKEIRLIVVKI